MATVQAPIRKRFSSAEYYQMGRLGLLDRRYELINGDIIEMPPIGPEHAETSTLLRRVIEPQVPEGCYVRDGLPLDLDGSQPQPDIAIVRGRLGDFKHRHPESAALVIEIAATGLEYDLEVKVALYAHAGIEEYWVVDLTNRRAITHRRPEGSSYREVALVSPPAKLTPSTLPSVTVDLEKLF